MKKLIKLFGAHYTTFAEKRAKVKELKVNSFTVINNK